MNISELVEVGVEELVLPCPIDFVYCLTEDCGEVVYIGRTNNVLRRVGSHFDEWTKSFCRAYAVDIDDFTADQVESALIRYFQPKYNKTLTKKGIGIPLGSIDQIIIDYFVKGNPIATKYQEAVDLL